MDYRCLSCENVHVQEDRFCNKCYHEMSKSGIKSANVAMQTEDRLKRKIQDLVQYNREASRRIEELEACNREASRRIEELEACNREASRRIEELEACNREASRRIEELEACNKKANRQIEHLNSSLAFLRSPPPLTDIVVVASDDPSPRSISANRAILASRSPVFRAMLENQMEESISGTIKIGQVSSEALSVFVSFLYTAEAANLDEQMACELLMLGDRYQIPHLKAYCERLLTYNLTWENSLPIYAFARQHNSPRLKDASLSLITKDIQKLPKRQDYAEFVDKDPRMILEIYEAGQLAMMVDE